MLNHLNDCIIFMHLYADILLKEIQNKTACFYKL